MRRLTTALAALALALSPAAVTAQDPADERWGFELGLALNASGGNEDLAVFSSSFGLTHLQKDAFELGLSGVVRYGRSRGEEVAQNTRAGINFDFRPQARWTPFLFATGESDPFRKLDLRFNGGAGVKRTFWRDDWSEVSLSGAALYSHEATDPAPGVDLVERTARWSWRVRGRREIGERSRVEQVVFYQPEWTHGGDYLLESLSSLRVGLTRAVTVDIRFRYDRDSTPAPEVAPDDWSLTTGISLDTRW